MTGNIRQAIDNIGAAQVDFDGDRDQETLKQHEATKEELDKHSQGVEVADKDLQNAVKSCKDLIESLRSSGADSTETEASIRQALQEVTGGNQAELDWLLKESGIDISKLDTTGEAKFGSDDLLGAVETTTEGPARHEQMFAILSGLNGASTQAQQLFSQAHFSRYETSTDPVEKQGVLDDWVTYIQSTLVKEREMKEPEKALVTAAEKVLADLDGITTAPETRDAGRDQAPESTETVETNKVAMAALAEFLGVSADSPEALKSALSTKLQAEGGPKAVLDFISGLKNNASLISSLAGKFPFSETAVKQAFEQVSKAVLGDLQNDFKDGVPDKLDKEKADRMAEGVVEGLDSLTPDQPNPFEMPDWAPGKAQERISDLFTNFPDIVSTDTEQLTTDKVEKYLKGILEKALSSNDADALRKLGSVLGFSFSETDPEKLKTHIKENESEIMKRIGEVAKEANGKSKAEAQREAIEANQAKASELIDQAAKEFPEHVGTPRWERWVNKLANGETQKSFAEYLAEDEPVEGLEVIILMLKKLFMQFKSLMDSFGKKEGETTLSEQLQADVDAAKDKIKNAYLGRLGEEFGLTAEQVEANRDGLSFVNENRDLLGAVPNLNIAGMDLNGDGQITPAEKVQTLQSMSPDQRDVLKTLLRSVEQKPYMKDVLQAGLDGTTIDAIYDFESNMSEKDRTADIKVEGGNLVVNGQTVELKPGNDNAIKDLLEATLKDEDGTLTTVERDTTTVRNSLERGEVKGEIELDGVHIKVGKEEPITKEFFDKAKAALGANPDLAKALEEGLSLATLEKFMKILEDPRAVKEEYVEFRNGYINLDSSEWFEWNDAFDYGGNLLSKEARFNEMLDRIAKDLNINTAPAEPTE